MASRDDVAQAVTRLKNFCDPFVGVAQILADVEELHLDVEDLVGQKSSLEQDIKSLTPLRDSLQAQVDALNKVVESK